MNIIMNAIPNALQRVFSTVTGRPRGCSTVHKSSKQTGVAYII